MTLVAIVPKIVVRNLFFLFHFVKDCRLSGYNNLFAVYKILHMGQFFCSVLCISIGNLSLRCLNDYTLG